MESQKISAKACIRTEMGILKASYFANLRALGRLGANSQNMSKMGKEEKQRRTRRSKEIMVFQIAYYKCTRVHYIYTRKKGNKSRHFLLLVRTIFVPLHIGKKSVQKVSSQNRHLEHGINIPYNRREKKARQDRGGLRQYVFR